MILQILAVIGTFIFICLCAYANWAVRHEESWYDKTLKRIWKDTKNGNL